MLRARNGQSIFEPIQKGEVPRQNTDVLHTHAHAELFACLRGVVHLQTARGILVLQPGDFAIVAPGFLHTKLPDTQPARFCAWAAVISHKREGKRIACPFPFK